MIAATHISANGSSGPNPAASQAAAASILNIKLHPYLATLSMANGITFKQMSQGSYEESPNKLQFDKHDCFYNLSPVKVSPKHYA